jgi:hypothetical protein
MPTLRNRKRKWQHKCMEAPISPRRVVVFKPSEVLKQRINAPRSHIDGTWIKEGIGGDQ